jgi:glycosyltransferase involved in cell wall biosynthesis
MLYLVVTKILGALATLFVAAGQLPLMVRWRKQPAERARSARDSQALRVLFVHRDLPLHGGVPQCLINLAGSLDAKRVEFHVASFNPPSEEMKLKFRDLGVEPRCIGDKGYVTPSRNLRSLVEENEIDILVATTFKAYICAKIAARGRDVGVVFWLHAVRGSVEGFFRRAICDFLTKDDPMLFVSRAVRDAQLPPGHRGPAEVVYNGVEDLAADPANQPYPREMRQVFGIPDTSLVLAYVGEFIIWKDHATAIEAMHELVRRNVDVHLLLIGTGQDIDLSRQQAAAGPAAKHIHFLGARSDVRRLLGLVDIYIHPSREEGFGLAVVEAMLASRPVIAAASTGAVIELIDSGHAGVLVKPGSPLAMADAIVELAADPQRAARMGEIARAACLEEYNIQKFADRIATFLEQSFPSAVRRHQQVVIPPLEAADIIPETAGVHG